MLQKQRKESKMETYCKIVNDAITEHMDRIGKAAKLNATVILAQEILPKAHIWIDYEVNIYWAVRDIDEVKEALREFAKKGILLEKFYPSKTNPQWQLKHGDYTIRLDPQWSKEEGASCKLVQVGLEPQPPRPIYKLVCEKGGLNGES